MIHLFIRYTLRRIIYCGQITFLKKEKHCVLRLIFLTVIWISDLHDSHCRRDVNILYQLFRVV